MDSMRSNGQLVSRRWAVRAWTRLKRIDYKLDVYFIVGIVTISSLTWCYALHFMNVLVGGGWEDEDVRWGCSPPLGFDWFDFNFWTILFYHIYMYNRVILASLDPACLVLCEAFPLSSCSRTGCVSSTIALYFFFCSTGWHSFCLLFSSLWEYFPISWVKLPKSSTIRPVFVGSMTLSMTLGMGHLGGSANSGMGIMYT